ncbi:lytic transglycosylase domain-containing protein [Paraburkholderia humisilvae]|nr:lytic transglycosylase domain-containing protein [Paraburkholderia humisilvae]
MRLSKVFVPVLLVIFPMVAHSAEGLSPQVLALAERCAPDVHPLTIAYLVNAESRNNPLAININGNYELPGQPATEREAREAVQRLERQGLNFDVGYAQINSANFRGLGLTGTQLLDGCTNLRAAARVLGDCYARAALTVGEGQAALQRALSCYNTGSQGKGFTNGYVARVLAQVRLRIPALLDGPLDPNGANNFPRKRRGVMSQTPPSSRTGKINRHDDISDPTKTQCNDGDSKAADQTELDDSPSSGVEVYRSYIRPGELQ